MTPAYRTGPVRVRVPATSANLGPGFDTAGLALALYDEVTVEVTASGLEIEVAGEGAASVPRDGSHLVVRAMAAAFDRLGVRPPGLALRCTNRIPHARGLGSSAAAIVAGVLAARALVPDAAGLDADGTLALAAGIEGHPDNVAACLAGGLTLSWLEAGGPRLLRLEPAVGLAPVAYIPAEGASTELARRLLPALVPHADAAANAARAALLPVALTTRPDLLLAATADLLHQPYRAPAMPASAQLVALLRAAGVAAVLSGAGPTVLALVSGPADRLPPAGPGWRRVPLEVDRGGARVN